MLRGPQGTLYGASSLGGLIKYVTRAPDLNEVIGRAEIGANTVDGGNEGWSARGSLNVPVISEELAVSVSGYYRDDSAYIDNIFPGLEEENVNRNEVYGGRVVVRARPTEGLTITLSALRQEQNTRNSHLSPSYGIPVCPECQGAGNTAVTNFTPLYGDFTTPHGEDIVVAEANRNPAARFQWFDPRTGQLRRPMPVADNSGRFAAGGAKGRGRDWLLLIHPA